MKTFNFFLLLAILSVSDYAFAQIPECPCDDLELPDGTTGNDIVELLCPGGELADNVFSLVQSNVIVLGDVDAGYAVESLEDEGEFCIIASSELDVELIFLTPEEYSDCRERLIQGCNLISIHPIPTLSEWGVIAMAGVLGVIGLILLRRRKVVA